MTVISARVSIGEIDCVVGIRYNQSLFIGNKKGSISPPGSVLSGFSREEVPTVRDFTLSPRERLASAIASATIVRDVAALGALVLFGTMLILVLSSADMLV
ncbi:hypothetical protein [Pleomorphomonas sp. JP5]|uniref:hypothetical protein n=1 Tax=Pleomorphomonas sp. JP5 TaxID=2942998 RepID=UPI0020449CFC|nr:hypothetical protein [Pleomorphomonas sp. JP5]MCM5556202.1 hypothetical protein [Pleomorphomonas sp. JP5]